MTENHSTPGRGPTKLGASIRAVLRWPDANGKQRAFYLIEGDTVQIGRGSQNDLIVEYPGISRHHAVIIWQDERFAIKDLGSTNGTAVDGELLTRSQELADGARIRLHDLEMTFFDVTPTSQEAVQAEIAAVRSVRETFVVAPDSPRPRLVVSAGPDEGREIPLHEGTITIGRATSRAAWDVPLQDRAVSRPHAQITKRDGDFVVADAGSANGTLLNGELVQEPTPLRDGDVLEMGQTTLLFRAM